MNVNSSCFEKNQIQYITMSFMKKTKSGILQTSKHVIGQILNQYAR